MKEFFLNHPEKMKEYRDNRSNKKHEISQYEWDECRKYFNFRCAYCGKTWEQNKKESKKDLHKEHVDPNGVDDLSNCIPSCRTCNTSKWVFGIEEWYTSENEVYDKNRREKIHSWLNEDYKKHFKR